MKVYFDNAATTPVSKTVLEGMIPYFTGMFGNANSVHALGREGEKAVMEARAAVARAVNCKENEVYFTSGGTEADNWALKGYCQRYKDKGNHIIVSAIEHAAVLESAKQLEAQGFKVTYLPVKQNGIIDMDGLKAALTDRTLLVSVMYANNEIGTVQPVREAAAAARAAGAAFHTDAVQAAGILPVDFTGSGFDMMSVSAHKFNGPKGTGALIIRSGIKPDKLLAGGHQERTMRGGTSNVPGIVGMGLAIAEAVQNRERHYAYVKELRDYFAARIENEIPYAHYNGDRIDRLPGNANFSFRFIEGEAILFSLDREGISASSGSACSSGSLEPSHVLLAIGLPHEIAHGSVRFSLSADNTREEADYTVEKLKKVVRRLREISPLKEAGLQARTAEINIQGENKYV
ncbi:MAG: cysteine desulfurase [Firmicutes bacterium]|nr:cysteine desulfurase [Bacillota bacterium]